MKFTIPRGQEFYCEFQIKEPGSGTPMDITGAIGVFSLSSIGYSCTVELTDVPMVVEDAVNGKISITLDETQTANLEGQLGFAEDGYPLLPTYKARIDVTGITTPISVDIPKVYVSEMTCPA